MTSSLDSLRQQVERHFNALSRMRKSSDSLIFAMEHCLSEESLNQMRCGLRSHWKSHSQLNESYWLLWIIYATEVGYSYTGEEYWQSFEEHIPNWEFQNRYRIRDWFRKFQREFNGVLPSGLWAEHFTIIAWPITHAILPVYLQRQFAKALYDLRYALASMKNQDPKTIGQLLAFNANISSNRFREFLQQEELVGRIVLALLGEKASPSYQNIYPQTLDRIIADLEKVRIAREWLRETRKFVDKFKGIGTGSQHPNGHQPRDPITDLEQSAIRPKVLLRHTGGGEWSVLLEVPSFRRLCTFNSDYLPILKSTRCRLNGGSDMKPRGWLLSGNRKGVLHSWPDTEKPLIELEEPHRIINPLLEAECRLTPGPWLFRVGSDGTARQITSRIVRPDYDYVLVKNGVFPSVHEIMSPCTLNCRGAKAFRLAIPSNVSAELHSWLEEIGLKVARTIQIWPAGLPGRGWDGEGNGEWLTTEKPCFGIFHDHPVDAYTFSINQGLEHLINTEGKVGPLFVKLPNLPAGTHCLTVKANRGDALNTVVSSPHAEGFVRLTVRAPEPWIPGVASHPGLIVTVDPVSPDLDAFWRNETRLSVIGPENYTVLFKVELQTSDGRKIFHEQVGDPIGLPVTPEKWRQRFKSFLNHKGRDEKYLEAAKGMLIIDGETLGSCSIVFEHDVKPVRWLTRRHHNDIMIRLLDDAGIEETKADVYCYDMDCPLKRSSLDLDIALRGSKVEPPGSLFYAEHNEFNDSIAVANIPTDMGLKGLALFPNIDAISRDLPEIMNALHVLHRWQAARLSGHLVEVRHWRVVNCILKAVYSSLCGKNWAEAESEFRNKPQSIEAHKKLISKVDKNTPSFAIDLGRNWSKIESGPAQRTAWFVEVAGHHKVCEDSKLCEFALRLASQSKLRSLPPQTDLKYLVDQILKHPVTLRGARLLALLSASKNDDSGKVPLLPRWQW